ncbi:MAG: UDP-N-acetylmuramoyl-tripeptide--D-alanyl-D-alanine ligase [Nocardioides sp.]
MIPLSVAEIAAVTGGEVHGDADAQVTAPATVDSRAVEPGGLFVAIAGEHVDGHDFAAAAHRAGAAAVLASRPTTAPTVVVDDVVVALGRLARHLLDRLPDLHLVALTGSQGKTGTKDYLAAVLADAGPTVATAGNLNNEIGVPLTVLRATAETAYLVVEMGARGIGHIAYLCEIAPPDVAAVLNVGTAHLAEFGSREAIAQAKGEILEALPPDGVAVVLADDGLTAGTAGRTAARVITFGERGDVGWRHVALDDLGRPAFDLGYDGAWLPVRLTGSGAHQVPNAAAAAALALALGLPLGGIVAALGTARPSSRWRMELHERADGVVVINDAYNANPESMVAAIEALGEIGARRGARTIAVLGGMRELGAASPTAHAEVGAAAARRGVDVLVTVGPEGDPMADSALATTGWGGTAVRTAGRDDASAWVRNNVRPGDVVLVKASRGVALEHVADGLLAPRPEGDSR